MLIRQDFTLTGALNKPILADLRYAEGFENAPMIVFVHGFKGFKDWGAHNLVADYFAGHGFRYLKFNFSHNGTTPEQPGEITDEVAFSGNTFSKEFEDLNQVISFIKSGSAFPAPASVTLMGHSRGGGTCIVQAAKDDRIDKLITWASVASFDSLWKPEQVNEWRETGVIYNFNSRTKQYTPLKIGLLNDLEAHPEEYDIRRNASQINKPWLIIHGENDINVTPDKALELVKNSNNAEMFMVPGTDHVFGASHPYENSELPLPLRLICEKSIEFINGSGIV